MSRKQKTKSKNCGCNFDERQFMRFVEDFLHLCCELLCLTLWHYLFLVYMVIKICMAYFVDDNSKNNKKRNFAKFSSEPNIESCGKEYTDCIQKSQSSPTLNSLYGNCLKTTNVAYLKTNHDQYLVKYKPLYNSCSSMESTTSYSTPFAYFETTITNLIPRFPESSKSSDIETTHSKRIPLNNIRKCKSSCVLPISNSLKEILTLESQTNNSTYRQRNFLKSASEPNIESCGKDNTYYFPESHSSPTLNSIYGNCLKTNDTYSETNYDEYLIKYKPLYNSCSSMESITSYSTPFAYFETTITNLIPRFLESSKSSDIETTHSKRIPLNNIRKFKSSCVLTISNSPKEILTLESQTEYSTNRLSKSKSPPKQKTEPQSVEEMTNSPSQDISYKSAQLDQVDEMSGQSRNQQEVPDTSPFNSTNPPKKRLRRVRKWFSRKTGMKHFFSRTTSQDQ